MKNHIFSLTLLITIISCGTKNKNTEGVTNIETSADTHQFKIEQIVNEQAEKILQDTLINALSIGVYQEGNMYTFHFGELTKGKMDKPNDRTLYEIASVTKTFTGTLAAKAVLEDRIQLDDDIDTFLPKSYENLKYQDTPIKVKHLLTHTSEIPGGFLGMPEINRDLTEIEFNDIVTNYENSRTKDLFLRDLSKLALNALPGTRFNYSNAGTNLMGFILERVYAKSFQELIEEEILGKAGMNDTYFHVPESEEYRLANGYLLGEPRPATKLAETLWGAEGALKSTLLDMLNYIQFQFDNGKMVEESHRKLYEIDKEYWIGYFWWVISNQNHDLHFRHDGGISRAKNVLVIYPESKIGISVFTNQSSATINNSLSKLTYDIYDNLKKLNKTGNSFNE
ncbi:MAG: serine hydrolase domain-containing protein [Croceivirga sp.]